MFTDPNPTQLSPADFRLHDQFFTIESLRWTTKKSRWDSEVLGWKACFWWVSFLTGEMARSKTKFTQSGPGKTFFSLLLFLMQSMWDISDCSTQFVQQRTVGGPAPWAKAKTHTDARGSSLFVERFSLQISKSHSVFGISSRGGVFFFYSWLLGYCGPSLRMTNSDIRSTKRYILLQNRYAFKSKQSHEFINHIIWVFYIAAENMTLIEKRWVGGRENKQLPNTLMIILHFVTELLWKNYVNYKKCCSAKEGFSEDTQVSENSSRKLWIKSS